MQEPTAERGVHFRFTLDDVPEADIVFDIHADSMLRIGLTVTAKAPFEYEAAFHTYFAVSDIEKVAVHGLHRAQYFDKVDQGTKDQSGPIHFDGEVDRIYYSQDRVSIYDADRIIRIAKQGSAESVVWNPGPEKARALSDMGDEDWRQFVCVEVANIGPSAIRLEPGQSHTMSSIVHLHDVRQ